MPIYEYQCQKCGVIEILHNIKDDPKTVCPECGTDGLVRKVSLPAGFIFKGRQANQYADIKAAKYWRDVNGDLHPVTPADGDLNSATVNRQTRSPQEIEYRRKQEKARKKKIRARQSYRRYLKNMKKPR